MDVDFDDFFKKHEYNLKKENLKKLENYSKDDNSIKKQKKKIQLSFNLKKRKSNLAKKMEQINNKYMLIKKNLEDKKMEKIEENFDNLKNTISDVFKQNDLILKKIINNEKNEIENDHEEIDLNQAVANLEKHANNKNEKKNNFQKIKKNLEKQNSEIKNINNFQNLINSDNYEEKKSEKKDFKNIYDNFLIEKTKKEKYIKFLQKEIKQKNHKIEILERLTNFKIKKKGNISDKKFTCKIVSENLNFFIKFDLFIKDLENEIVIRKTNLEKSRIKENEVLKIKDENFYEFFIMIFGEVNKDFVKVNN